MKTGAARATGGFQVLTEGRGSDYRLVLARIRS